MDLAWSNDYIGLAYELVAAGDSEALSALLAEVRQRERRQLERGDFVASLRLLDSQLTREVRPSIWQVAVRAGHGHLVRVLLDAGFSPNARDAGGSTVLLVATAAQSVTAVRGLLAAGADPNARSSGGVSPLSAAWSEQIVDLLVDAGADPNALDDNGDTPLVAHAFGDDPRVALQLVRRGSYPHARDLERRTLLGALLERWDDELDLQVVQDLVDAGYDPAQEQERFGDYYPSTSETVDAFLRGLGVVVGESVREFSDEFDDDALEALEAALMDEDFWRVDMLVESFINHGNVMQDPWGNDAFTAMALAGYTPGVEALAQAGVRPQRADGNSFATAYEVIRSGAFGLLEALVPLGANPNASGHDGLRVLHLAARDDSDDLLVAIVLDLGADPNERDRAGRTPLHIANTAKAMQRLLDAGADVDAQDADGYTPLFHAARARDAQLIAVLLHNGADPNARSPLVDASPTAVHALMGDPTATWPSLRPVAALEAALSTLFEGGFDLRLHQERHGDVFLMPTSNHPDGVTDAIARLLLANGADPNRRDPRGRTPLHHAAAPLKVGPYLNAAIEALAEAGADLDARDDLGDTPLLAALKVGHGIEGRSVVKAFAYFPRNFAGFKAQRSGGERPPIPTPGETPTESVFREGHVAPYGAVERLISCGANVNTVDRAGRSPLHYAAAWGSASTITSLLEAGADPNAVDELGLTPLLAAFSGTRLKGGSTTRIAEPEIFELLVAGGANPHTVAPIGISAHEVVASALLAANDFVDQWK